MTARVGYLIRAGERHRRRFRRPIRGATNTAATAILTCPTIGDTTSRGRTRDPPHAEHRYGGGRRRVQLVSQIRVFEQLATRSLPALAAWFSEPGARHDRGLARCHHPAAQAVFLHSNHELATGSGGDAPGFAK